MDNYTLSLFKNTGKKFNITSIAQDLSWRDSIDTLGMELSFNVARNIDDKYIKNYDVLEVGDKLLLSNNGKEVIRGIVTDETINRYSKNIIAFDYAFYLNKSKIIIQFNKIKADDAIRQLCSKFNITTGNITPISTLITKIYKDNTIAEIIKDILDIATKELGMKYRLEMRVGRLYIEKYQDLIVNAVFKPASNIASFDITKAIGSISISRSIQDMKNSIIITSSDEKSTRVYTNAKDDTSINNYGLLQDTQSIEDKDIAQANNIAQNQLKLLNRIVENTSIELLGSDLVRAGRILKIEEKTSGLFGNYLVKDCTHTYNNRIHKMQLNIEGVVL